MEGPEEDGGPSADRNDRIGRARVHALQGMAIAVGVPAGWLVIRILAGADAAVELGSQAAVYLYMLIGTTLAFGLFGYRLGRHEDRLLAANRRISELSLTDSLTGLRNGRYFFGRLDEEHARSERSGEPLAVAIIDLDHFKRVNDRFGHPTGDEVLVHTARAIASVTRQGDTEARVGGEEFALLLPGSTGERARVVAERVRIAIQEDETPVEKKGTTVRVTASAGVASTAELNGAGTQELYAAADDALLEAKRQGRDRTVVAGDSG